MILAGERDVDLATALDALGVRGFRAVLAEGGPTLNGQLAAAGLLDELCLTLSPRLVGGGAKRILDGVALPGAPNLRLYSVCEQDGFLFLRYREDLATPWQRLSTATLIQHLPTLVGVRCTRIHGALLLRAFWRNLRFAPPSARPMLAALTPGLRAPAALAHDGDLDGCGHRGASLASAPANEVRHPAGPMAGGPCSWGVARALTRDLHIGLVHLPAVSHGVAAWPGGSAGSGVKRGTHR